MVSLKRYRRTTREMKRVAAEIEKSDKEVARLRDLCPCHVGFDVFEQNVSLVTRLLRHPNQVVRSHALHILNDAAVMQSKEELRNSLEPGEEKIGEKRASARYRSLAERVEARRDNRIRKGRKNRRRAEY